MKYFVILLATLVLGSCGTTVDIDYDQKVNFESYNTYNYFSEIDSGLSKLDDNRIIKITDSLLQQQGFVRSNTPQILINFFAQETISNSRNTIGVGLGGVGVGVGGGIPIGGPRINQRLTIDFVEAERDDLIWQAVVDGDYKERSKPLQKEKYYAKALLKAFSKYPPKRKH